MQLNTRKKTTQSKSGPKNSTDIPPKKTYRWLLLSHFNRVQLCATPETAAHQAPPSLGFSRQEHWSVLPCPSPMHESQLLEKLLRKQDSVTAEF